MQENIETSKYAINKLFPVKNLNKNHFLTKSLETDDLDKAISL
jgi:hypothetical protein